MVVLRLTALTLAVGAISLFQAIFFLTITTLPKHALLGRITGVAALSGATYLVKICAIDLIEEHQRRHLPNALLWTQLFTCAAYILVMRVDAGHLDELVMREVSERSRKNGILPAHNIKRTLEQRIRSSVALSFNLRAINTPWQVKDLCFRNQERIYFIIEVLAMTGRAYLFLDAISLAPPPDVRLAAPEKQIVWGFWNLPIEDLIFRAATAPAFLLAAYAIIYMPVHATALLSVLLGFTSPDAWPYLFGSVSDVRSIRSFWGHFWHKLPRNALVGFADLITYEILRIPKKSTLVRHSRVVFAFAISGLLHYITELAMGQPAVAAGAFRFFMLQPVGIGLEEFAQSVTTSWRVPGAVSRGVGLVWMVVWMMATTPTWLFPVIRQEQSAEIVPFPWIKHALP